MLKLVVKVGDRLVLDFLVRNAQFWVSFCLTLCHQENLLRLKLLFFALFQAEQLKAEAHGAAGIPASFRGF